MILVLQANQSAHNARSEYMNSSLFPVSAAPASIFHLLHLLLISINIKWLQRRSIINQCAHLELQKDSMVWSLPDSLEKKMYTAVQSHAYCRSKQINPSGLQSRIPVLGRPRKIWTLQVFFKVFSYIVHLIKLILCPNIYICFSHEEE